MDLRDRPGDRARGLRAAACGDEHLILGHESLGRVIHAPSGSGFSRGDLAVGIVRRPDPEPCGACASGEFDMCRNGRYTERGTATPPPGGRAGPIGLLAALLGVQRGLEVHVLDRVVEGPKPALAAALGVKYHTADMADVTERIRPDIVIEATGAGAVVLDAIAGTAPYGITCLTGVSAAGRTISTDACA